MDYSIYRRCCCQRERLPLQVLLSRLGQHAKIFSPRPLLLSLRRFEAALGETFFVISEVDFTLENLASWMKPTAVATPLITKPASSKIMHDPKGVLLVRRRCLPPSLPPLFA